MKAKEAAKLLANRTNQEHYVLHIMEKVYTAGLSEGRSEAKMQFSNEELKEMCNEMLFQITGNYVEEHEQCERQGDSNWQIAMYYFRKLNNQII